MKKILFFFLALSSSLSAQTWHDGHWYALYDDAEHTMSTQDDYSTSVFAPVGGKLTVKWRYEWIDWVGFARKIDTQVLESADGGNTSVEVGALAENTDKNSQTTESFTLSRDVNWLKFNREGLPTHKVILTHLDAPLAPHILLSSGTYGTTADSYDFGELYALAVSEPYTLKLRSFLSSDDITVTSSDPEIFRLASEDNTEPVVFAVGANACASAKGKAAETAEGVLANIANYYVPVYFTPKEGKDYEAQITVTDGTSTATLTLTGTGKKKSQYILWEQDSPVYSSATLQPAKASSGLPVEYAITPEGIVEYKDDAFTILTTGTVEITASQPGNEVWLPAPELTKSVTVLPAQTRFDYAAAICQGDAWTDELFTDLTEAGLYYDTLVNVFGSDSVVCLTLTVHPSYSLEQSRTIYVGAEETWEEQDLSKQPLGESTLTAEYTSVHGCDSVLTLHLTVLERPASYGDDTLHLCEGESAVYEGKTYDKATKEEVLLEQKNTLGGDSIVNLVVQVHPLFSSTTELTIMVGEERTWQGKDLSKFPVGETTLTADYTSVWGCDSVFTLQLTVIPRPVTYGADTLHICEGGSVGYYGRFYDHATKESVLISEKNIYGGDSIVNLVVMVHKAFVRVEELTVKKGSHTLWQDIDLGQLPVGDSTLVVKYSSAYGCDSTYVLHLQVVALPASYGALTLNICSGETVTFEGKTYKRPTTDTVLVSQPNQFGGDSLVVLVVYVRPAMNLTTSQIISQGEHVEWQGQDLGLLPVGDTTLVAEYVSIYGCDSTFTLHLTVKEPTATGFDQSPFPSGEGWGEASKILYRGSLYIRKGDDLYDLTGRKLR